VQNRQPKADADTPVAVALRAVEKAAIVTRHVQSQLGRLRAMTKDDRSPVTIADFASQAVVARELSSRLGTIVLVAEESAAFLRQREHAAHLQATISALRDSGAWPDAAAEQVLACIDLGAGEPTATGTFWTLDPIDGTKGFLRNQQYCIALALIEQGRTSIGVMGCPNLPMSSTAALDVPDPRGLLIHAIRGKGAFDPVRIQPRLPALRGPARMAISVEAEHSDHDEATRILTRAAPGFRTVRLDSQCKYAVVARNQADAYLRLPTKPGYVERIWDHAAGSLIAEESGCVVTDIDNKPLDFSKGRGLEDNRGVVVAPPELHTKIVAALAASRP